MILTPHPPSVRIISQMRIIQPDENHRVFPADFSLVGWVQALRNPPSSRGWCFVTAEVRRSRVRQNAGFPHSGECGYTSFEV